MPEPTDLDSLAGAVAALRAELAALRCEVASLKAGAPRPCLICPSCRARCEVDSRHCGRCGALLARPAAKEAPKGPLAKAPPIKAPPPRAPAAPPPGAEKPAKAARGLSAERYIGERVLQYAGATILAVGVGFFLVWRAAYTGPTEKVVGAAVVGLILVVLGEWLKRTPPYDKVSSGVIGGGWTILYLTAYAAHHFSATRVVEAPGAALALLLVVAAGMIAHALALGSKAFRLFGFGLAYFVLLICKPDVAGSEVHIVLLAASILLSVQTGHADILLVSSIGFYVNFVPAWTRVINTPPPGGPTLSHFLGEFAPLGIGYMLLAVLPLASPARERLLRPESERETDLALCVNAVVFCFLATLMVGGYFHGLSVKKALGLSLLLDIPGLAYVFLLPRKYAFTTAAPALGLLVLSLGILEIGAPMPKMLAWLAASAVWTWIGLLLDHKAWRVSGLAMGMLTFAVYLEVAGRAPDSRRAAAGAMFFFSAVSYLASRYYRLWLKGEVADWEKPATEFWLYVGSASLVLGLWGVLDPAPFVVALIALAVAGEHAAAFFGRVHLWGQASAVALFAGLYTFFIDFGANLPAAGPLTPRVLAAGSVVMGMAYLYYGEPTPAEFTRPWRAWSIERHRLWLTWLMAAVACFAVYNELDGRMRLPVWAVLSVALYFLGSSRDEDHLKQQGVLLAAATGVEGVFSYLVHPGPLLESPTSTDTLIYWASAALPLVNLTFAKDGRRRLTASDRQASWAFCCLSMAMMALYLSKELESYHLTLALSIEGMAALVLGMALGYAELRYPALLLLGLCVFKAMIHDTSQLPLPQRVATLIVLGLILLGASMLYVRMGKSDDDANPPPS